jgi:mannan endo-1,6-alpha-mannosidase
MTLYPGNQTGNEVGVLPGPPDEHKGPYYWWQAGAMWGAMIDYWHYTGDTTYNKLTTDGIINQIGEDQDFEPKRHRASLGNDDQGFWAMTAMLAAENRFPDPPGAGKEVPGWLGLAQAVWVRQTMPERQDEACGGGLRWQAPSAGWAGGIVYKNTIANGCYFNIGARLTRYTGNETYAKHAEKIWDWMWDHHFIDHETWRVYDGAVVTDNCTKVNTEQFSYNAGVLLQGAAAMWNHASPP